MGRLPQAPQQWADEEGRIRFQPLIIISRMIAVVAKAEDQGREGMSSMLKATVVAAPRIFLSGSDNPGSATDGLGKNFRGLAPKSFSSIIFFWLGRPWFGLFCFN